MTWNSIDNVRSDLVSVSLSQSNQNIVKFACSRAFVPKKLKTLENVKTHASAKLHDDRQRTTVFAFQRIRPEKWHRGEMQYGATVCKDGFISMTHIGAIVFNNINLLMTRIDAKVCKTINFLIERIGKTVCYSVKPNIYVSSHILLHKCFSAMDWS